MNSKFIVRELVNSRLSLYFCGGVAIVLGIVSPADAYNPKHLKTLISTKKCVGCDLSGANLSRQQLVNADLRAANLVGANLTDANLTSAKLDGANLTGADLTRTNLTRANLQAASLIDVSFDRTNLTNTDLSYANLVNTNFSTAILKNTDLAGANLALADFTGANLSTTALTNANLVGAKGIPPSPSPIPTPTIAPIKPLFPSFGPGNDNSVPGNRNAVPNTSIQESSPSLRRPRIYRIPTGLGRPDRLIPGGTRHSTSPENESQ